MIGIIIENIDIGISGNITSTKYCFAGKQLSLFNIKILTNSPTIANIIEIINALYAGIPILKAIYVKIKLNTKITEMAN